MNKNTFWSYSLLTAVMVLAGCGGGGGGGGGGSSTGVLSDSAVAGVAYTSSPSGLTGTTNANGEFNYRQGDTVAFTLAGLVLPSVTATGRITPSTLAKELVASGAVTGDANTVALNLALLFQALDDDGNPDNGISVIDIDLSSLIIETELANPPATFAANLDAADTGGELVVPDPAAAAEHYYLNELVGNWRLDYIDHEEGVIEPTSDFGIFVAFDASGNSLWVEYETEGSPAACSPFQTGYSAIYTGAATFAVDGEITMESNERDLLTGCVAGSTDHVADMFGGEITFDGDQLVITHPSVTARKSYFNRFDNEKNTLVGFWAESESTTTRYADATLEFGGEIDGLYNFFTSDRWVTVVLDRLPGGENCEYNGVHVSSYTVTGSAVDATSLLNHIWENPANCDKEVWTAFNFDASEDNDATLPLTNEGFSLLRNLSQEEAAGDFAQSTLTGSWAISDTVDETGCGGEIYLDEYDADVTQMGTSLSVVIGVESYSGSLSGDALYWSGSYSEDGGTTTSTVSATFEGDGSLSGSSSWSFTDGVDSCEGTSTFTATRNL